ncbi:hypothetical protein [Amycolatopsis sp. WQ 127309]|uniref:hypothetical protein n=1 Tax=Amycolatopsis sp. WQ 127309 TaxID=2932773 RepID=UPI001FF123DA|nr:hypothetical protein [Amycolatopsis sp. WQ 127309]UOZ06915.1 hypothetical protein MUY22_01070 [Amycolatopsis sp. WQ 127309]
MTDPSGSGSFLVGAHDESSPGFDASQYQNLDDIEKATNDLVYNSDGAKAGLSHSSVAEAWYDLQSDLDAAVKRIGEANDAMATEVKALRDSLSGEAGDAFQDYATGVLKQSEELYDSLNGKYPTAIGNVGHAIQAFAAGWWDIFDAADKKWQDANQKLWDAGKAQADAATTTQAADAAATDYQKALDKLNKDSEAELLKELQGALNALSGQIQNRGHDLAPIHIIDGHAQPGTGVTSTSSYAGSDRLPGDEYTPAIPGEPATAGAGDVPRTDEEAGQAKQTADDAAADLDAAAGDGTADPASDTAADPASGSTDPASGSTDPASGSADPQSGSEGTDSGAADSGQDDQQALDDAKQAANDAIDDLSGSDGSGTGSDGSGSGGSGSDGSGTGADGSGTGSDGSGAGGGVPTTSGGGSGSGSGSGDDAKRKKALDDAKQAADDAIDGLSTGQPATESSGPDGEASGDPAAAAKDAAGQAIDGVAKPSDSPAQQQALDQAKQAAQKAIDDAAADGVTDPQQLGDAAGKAIDDLAGQTDDPAAKQSLEDAKQAAMDAINSGADTPRQHALDDAKAAADQAIDALGQPGDSPAETQALADAKTAVDNAIDGLGSGDSLQQFLGAGDQSADAGAAAAGSAGLDSSGASFDPGSGSSGGGSVTTGGGGSLTPAASEVPLGQFDTQPGQGGVPAPVAAATATPASGVPDANALAQQAGGMPMGGMGGGMGGMGGAQGENKEREPQIWLQAEQGAWGDQDHDGPPHHSVLGRD